MTDAELRALVGRELAMREPRCTCGHILTAHSRRKTICYSRRCGCTRWTPEPDIQWIDLDGISEKLAELPDDAGTTPPAAH